MRPEREPSGWAIVLQGVLALVVAATSGWALALTLTITLTLGPFAAWGFVALRAHLVGSVLLCVAAGIALTVSRHVTGGRWQPLD